MDGAVEANLAWWVDGPQRDASGVDPEVRDLGTANATASVRGAAGWDDIEEATDPRSSTGPRSTGWRNPSAHPDPRGGLDLEAIQNAARQLTEGIPGALSNRLAKHCPSAPSMEHPDEFLTLLRDWLTVRKAPDLS